MLSVVYITWTFPFFSFYLFIFGHSGSSFLSGLFSSCDEQMLAPL